MLLHWSRKFDSLGGELPILLFVGEFSKQGGYPVLYLMYK